MDFLGSQFWPLLILLCPLAAFVVQIFIGRFLPRKGDWVSLAAIGISLLISVACFAQVLIKKDPHFTAGFPSYQWLTAGMFTIKMGILFDNITAIMLVVVTLVSFLVHLYSVGYMHGDIRYSRFFAYLSLFSFSMIGLVLSNNLLSLYIFWELVGVSSYLLIGFWFEKVSAANACKKAFVTNRVGDFGFFLGILLIIFFLGKTEYGEVFNALKMSRPVDFTEGWLTFAGVCLFMGAVGKSAQFPLHVWLPDAMEGPTPVSALIHAATMVAAGVYMVTRLYPVFTPDALLVIAYVGGFTAIFAATIALVQNDIKRVLAYSTVSQLGYMVMGLGVGGYVAGFYHLWTHAFFKALLFLCSGSVIHALHSQDLRDMGGLWKKMPITFVAMTIGTLAISGFPPYFVSGFYSKDGILGATLALVMERPQHFVLAIFGFLGAAFTAFYMFRLIYMTFTGHPRDEHKYEHAHESPWTMTVPLMVLAVLSICSAGFFSGSEWFGDYVQKPESAVVMAHVPAGAHEAVAGSEAVHEGGHSTEHAAHQYAVILSILIVFISITLATLTYYHKFKKISAEKIAERLKPVYNLLYNKYYIDEIYEKFIIRPVVRFTKLCSRFDSGVIDGAVNGTAKATVFAAFATGQHDLKVIDGAVNGVAQTVIAAGKGAGMMQTGRIKNYFAWAVGGMVCILGLIYLLLLRR
ncbi:MAG: NADH-quinone oxidoreductase subunit L [Planctomycetes bacterium]|nr:NADH-quinone oxidoreductase subunit L [Planctomycetota bacterium]